MNGSSTQASLTLPMQFTYLWLVALPFCGALAPLASTIRNQPISATENFASPRLPCHEAATMRLDFGQPEADEDAYTVSSVPAAAGAVVVEFAPPPPPAPSATRIAEAVKLAAWVEKEGGNTAGAAAQPADVGGGVGLAATKDARRGDTLLAVPLDLGLSAESCLRSDIGPYLAEFDPNLADYAFIALHLLHERRRGAQSALAAWVSGSPSLLPAHGFDDLPLLWGGDGLALLDAATTAGASRRFSQLTEDYQSLAETVFAAHPDVFPRDAFSFPAYAQAVAIALSRAVPVKDGAEDEPRPILLPLVDLANHDGQRPAAALRLEKPKGGLFGGSAGPVCVLLVATGDVPSGQAVCVRYGGATAGELLLDYGVLDEPVAPVAPLSFALDDGDTYWDEKDDVLDMCGLGTEGTWLLAESSEEIEAVPAELIASFA